MWIGTVPKVAQSSADGLHVLGIEAQLRAAEATASSRTFASQAGNRCKLGLAGLGRNLTDHTQLQNCDKQVQETTEKGDLVSGALTPDCVALS